MKIYNKDKTKILTNVDTNSGKLIEDKLTITTPEVVGVAEQGHYETVVEYPNGGKDVKWVIDVEGVEAQEAKTETEDILVYIPYTDKEIEEIALQKLRFNRTHLLVAFDKWEKAVLRGREVDDKSIMSWYQDLLDLKDSAFENIPERINYYR